MAALVKPLLRSFAGGEIAPELFGRLDLDKFQTGLGEALNFKVLPHGPAQNRAGTQYVLHARPDDIEPQVRVIPFAYSDTDTMVLELGDNKIRFHTQGATLLEGAQNLPVGGISNSNPALVTRNAHGYSDGDWVFFNADSMPQIHRQFFIVDNATANDFTLNYLDGSPIDSTTYPVFDAAGADVARVYEIDSPFDGADIFGIHYTQSADVLTLVHPSYEPMELRRLGPTNWVLSTIVFAPAVATPAVPVLAAVGPGGGTPINHTYVVTALSAAGEESLASPSATLARDLTVVGNAIDIDPPVVSGAVRFNVYELKNGLYGFIGQCDGTAFRDNNIVPDSTQTPPEANNPFVGADNYPSTVTYFEQRRCFAATNNLPQHHFLTRSATESNLTQSIPVRDGDAIIFRIAAAQQNRVRHLIPLADLMSLTVGAVFRIAPVADEFLTPSNVKPSPQCYVGANNVQPLLAETSCLYVQSRGSHVRELRSAGQEGNYGYRSDDLSLLAFHLVDNYTIVDAAFSTAPVPEAWFIRSDGVALCMTYVPGQNVRAWTHHATNGGAFESVCAVAEGDEDGVYFVVRRTIGGRTVRYIERLHTRVFTEQADAFFVDAGSTYDGDPTSVLYGLRHLVGETVSILGDGAVFPQQTVAEHGMLTLEQPVSKAHAGEPIRSRMRTLPLSWQTDGFGQGQIKNVGTAHLRLSAAGGVHIGPADGRLVEVKQRTSEPYGTPPALMTGWRDVNLFPKWQDDGAVELEQNDPLPVTVLAMVLDVSAAG